MRKGCRKGFEGCERNCRQGQVGFMGAGRGDVGEGHRLGGGLGLAGTPPLLGKLRQGEGTPHPGGLQGLTLGESDPAPIPGASGVSPRLLSPCSERVPPVSLHSVL